MSPEPTQQGAGSPLSPQQWQALGRLADRYQRIEEAGQFLAREFGGAASERVLELAELVQDPRLAETLHELNATLIVLAQTGYLKKLREFAQFASESETYLDMNTLVQSLMQTVGNVPVGRFMAALGGESITPEQKPAGGWKGLFSVLRNTEVQTGLVVLGRFFQRLRHDAG